MPRRFNGSNQWLEKTHAAVSGAPMSMACWFFVDGLTLEYAIMCIGDSSSATDFFQLNARGDASDGLYFRARNSSATIAQAGAWSYSVATWHHALGTMDASGNLAVYLDGGSKNTTSITPTFSGIDKTTVGTRYYLGARQNYLDGMIGEAAVWNIDLNDAEAAALGAGYSPFHIRPQSLVAYWPIMGRSSPEIDLIKGDSFTVNGATAPTSSPRIVYPVPYQYDHSLPPDTIIKQMQKENLGASLFDGTLVG